MLKRKMNQSVFTRRYLVADARPREIIISLAGLTQLLKLLPGLSGQGVREEREKKKRNITLGIRSTPTVKMLSTPIKTIHQSRY
jgi:hypothetical protein